MAVVAFGPRRRFFPMTGLQTFLSGLAPPPITELSRQSASLGVAALKEVVECDHAPALLRG